MDPTPHPCPQALLASVQTAGTTGEGEEGRERVEGERSVGTALAQVLVKKGDLRGATAVLEGLGTLQVRLVFGRLRC